MRDLRETANKAEELLRAAGVKKYALQVKESEKRELNTELETFSLFRTIFGVSAAVTVFMDGKKGTAAGNDLSDEGLEKVIGEAAAAAASAEEDPANDIAPDQGKKQAAEGPQEADMEGLYDRMRELYEAIEKEYPKVKMMQMIGSHEADHTIYRNSNGTEFDCRDGMYEMMLEFSAFEGDRGTGISFTGFDLRDLGQPFLEQADVRRQIADAEAALTVAEVKEKFEGKVLLTPRAMAEFTYMLVQNYMGGARILSGESMWLNKIGEKVSSDKLTLRLQASDPRLVTASHFTEDGFAAENVTLIEDGVLKNHVINLYIANKTGRPVTKAGGFSFVVEPGSVPEADLLAQMDRGLIVGGFSGGEPGANGEFSGVAKNSFYVEKGKVAGAVNEVMISGNLAGLFEKMIGLSDTLVSDGAMAMPAMLTEGVTISGK